MSITKSGFETAICSIHIYTLTHETNFYMQKNKFTSHKHYLRVCTSLEIQNRLILTKVYCKLFYSNWKGATQKPSKVTSAKNFFQCIFYWWMLFIPCDNSKTLHFIVTQRFFSVAIFLLSLKRVFWEKSAFFTFSTITVLY